MALESDKILYDAIGLSEAELDQFTEAFIAFSDKVIDDYFNSLTTTKVCDETESDHLLQGLKSETS